MVIKFVCPNGHPLSAADDRAGRPGQCPRCDTKFLVPQIEEADAATATGDSSSGSAVGKAPTDEKIVFLCPNGHQLNGPASLKGKAGKCPHCGEKFRIPTFEEEEEEEAVAPPAIPAENPVEELELLEDEEVETFQEVPPPVGRFPAAEGQNTLAGVFTRLWESRGAGELVKVHLQGGDTIAPHHFAEGLSQGENAIFAVKEEGAGYRLHVVAWRAVMHVEVEKVAKLPPGIFD